MRIKIVVLLAAFILLAGVALANATPAIERYVLGGGGGRVEAGPYRLDGTMGQGVVGTVSDGAYELCSGFWCGGAVEHRNYLPLILRD